jgi:hypothetical protein
MHRLYGTDGKLGTTCLHFLFDCERQVSVVRFNLESLLTDPLHILHNHYMRRLVANCNF